MRNAAAHPRRFPALVYLKGCNLFSAFQVLMQKLAEVVPLLKLLFLLPYVLLSVKRLIMIQPNSNKKGGTLCEVIFKNL